MLFDEHIPSRKSKEIYGLIRQKGIVSKQELKEWSKLTSTTLTRVLEELQQQKWIEETGYGDSTGGRPPILYRTNPQRAFVFGLEISRTHAELLLCDLHLNALESQRWTMSSSMTPERLVDEVMLEIASMLIRRQLTSASIIGLGIGAVGPLDRHKGIILNPQHFPSEHWQHVHIVDLMQDRLKFKVYLDNGANHAILGEYWSHPDDRLQHLLYVHIGVGIRTSIIINGEIMYGAVDMEGAAGQMIIQAEGGAIRDLEGKDGTWENYASIPAMEQAAMKGMENGCVTSLWNEVASVNELTYALLERALAAGDSFVTELFLQSAHCFGIGLANMLNMIHPQKVILGGPLISGNSVYFEQAVRAARNKIYASALYKAVFEKSRLGENAVAIGAAAAVVNRMIV